MRGYELKRREFIQVLLSLPLSYAVACPEEERTVEQESLSRLVLALGPWSADDRELAEEFVGRFLATEHMVGLYLPDSSAVIQGLARRFPEGVMSVGDVDLATLPEEEREFVVGFIQQLYSLVEVRFFISNEPRWGVCLGERTRYTQAPG